MNKNIIIAIIAVLVVVGGGVALYKSNQSSVSSYSYNANVQTPQNNVQGQTDANAKVKFADSQDFQYFYLISTDNYDTNTKLALTGFDVTKNILSDGTLQIHLSAREPGYTSQDYTLKSGQKLYFYEKYLQDDQNEQETNLKDDKAILVDQDGYVVQ